MAVTLTGEASYSELARICDDNCEPFETQEQTELFIKAASMLRRREPSEHERDGVRVNKRDLMDQIAEARKALAIFQITSRDVSVIVPTNDLQ